MKTRKLETMTDFIRGVLGYTSESHNYERGIALIRWYSDLLNQPLELDMFVGDNPLLPEFSVVSNLYHVVNDGLIAGVFKSDNGEFHITLYRKSEHSISKNGMAFITSYHLKTIGDLCGKDLEFNIESKYAETEIEID